MTRLAGALRGCRLLSAAGDHGAFGRYRLRSCTRSLSDVQSLVVTIRFHVLAGDLVSNVIAPLLLGSHAAALQWAADAQSAVVQCRPAASSTSGTGGGADSGSADADASTSAAAAAAAAAGSDAAALAACRALEGVLDALVRCCLGGAQTAATRALGAALTPRLVESFGHYRIEPFLHDAALPQVRYICCGFSVVVFFFSCASRCTASAIGITCLHLQSLKVAAFSSICIGVLTVVMARLPALRFQRQPQRLAAALPAAEGLEACSVALGLADEGFEGLSGSLRARLRQAAQGLQQEYLARARDVILSTDLATAEVRFLKSRLPNSWLCRWDRFLQC